MRPRAHIEYGSYFGTDSPNQCLPLTSSKKLEPEQVKILSVKVNDEISRDVQEPNLDAQSILQVEVPPWAESYEFSATGVEGEQVWLQSHGHPLTIKLR